MKKLLYSSTALAAASAIALIPTGDAGAAQKAKKIQMGFGGGMTALVGFANNETSSEKTAASDVAGTTHYDAFNVWTNTEVEVKGSVKLDNGITVSVEVEFEGDQVTTASGSSVDNTFMRVSGGFGSIAVGSLAPPTAILSNSAPWTGAIFPGVEDTFWIQQPNTTAGGGPIGKMSTGNGSSDILQLAYISKPYGGLRMGAYVMPSTTRTNEKMPAIGGSSGTEAQEYGVSVNYNTKFGSTTVKADVGHWVKRGAAASSTDTTRFGVKLGFGDVTVGGSYYNSGNSATGIKGTSNSAEDQRWDMGVLYKQKGYSIGLHYLTGKRPESSDTAGDDEKSIFSLGATYALGPGVSAVGTIFWVEYEDELTNDTNNNKGWAAVAGIKVRF